MMLGVLRYVALVLLLASPVAAQAGKTYGLVIGVNNYRFVPTLDGARSDAMDIATALSRTGASVITLIDENATKQNIVRAWQSLLNQAKAGDVILMSYAGHGAQAPERIAGDESDRLDEFWVLPGFDPNNIKATWQETIFDNDLHQWFSEASRRGIHVVFVSDSCHAGGMDRAVTGRLRYVDVGKNRLLAELLALMLKDDRRGGTSQASAARLPDHVTMLAATGESQPVPEVVIDGRPRGALSWSVARALEGKADRNGDGQLTRTELEDYIIATVRMRSESLQMPVFNPVAARTGEETVVSLRPEAGIEVASQPAGQGAQPPVPMARDLGFEPLLAVSVKGSDIRPENTVRARYSYEWDATKGVFRTPNGDIAGENISSYTVNDVVSKYILLDFLQAIASKKTGRTSISPQKALYREGERIKFDSLRGDYKNMLVFNLANTGEVQFLDMVANGTPSRESFLKEMQVVAPFGADHLVTIATNAPVDYIGSAIERGVTPKELLQIMSARIDGVDAEVSIIPLYTRGK